MKKYLVTIPVEEDLYTAWRKHVKLIYGITPSGRKGGIMKKNSEVFSAEITRLMRHEKDNTR